MNVFINDDQRYSNVTFTYFKEVRLKKGVTQHFVDLLFRKFVQL